MDDSPNDVRLTDAQLGILAALCRPLAGGDRLATPATDREIADELFISVDAAKGHLRTLYRRFGIQDLPRHQRRARLVELTIEGGYLPPPEPASVPLGAATVLAEERERGRKTKSGRPIGPYVTMAILIFVVIAAALSISGLFNQGSTAVKPPTPAAYRAEVAGDCRQALAGAPETSGQDRAERARGYLEVIEALRGRLESQVQPAIPDIALERFTVGLTNAANHTSDVAEKPAPRGSPAEAKDVAELTFAAGQVQAGAEGYKLGPECLAIADLVAESAQNAAAP